MVSTISSINITPTAQSGVLCTGGMLSVATWFTGLISRLLFIPIRLDIFSPEVLLLTLITLQALVHDDIPPMVAVFTYHNIELEKGGSSTFQSQGIAWSIDKGRTWTKYSGNPVLPNPGKRDFRDPKVFWHEETGKWIMILAVHDRVNLFSSADLKSWSFESEFGVDAGAHGGVWECPDLFPLKVEGSTDTKWVMLVSINPGGPNGGSATQYFTGKFDGNKFIADENTSKWIDWGTDNYAGVTWSGIPETDGRRLFLGWMSNWNYATVVPTTTWRSAMTIPRELSLVYRKWIRIILYPDRSRNLISSGKNRNRLFLVRSVIHQMGIL